MSPTQAPEDPDEFIPGLDGSLDTGHGEDPDAKEALDPAVWNKVDWVVLPAVTMLYFLASLVGGCMCFVECCVNEEFVVYRIVLTSRTPPSLGF